MKGKGLILVALLLCLTFSLPVASQSSGNYALTWFTVDGGGGMLSQGGGFSLSGTIGQPDAGVLAGDGYALGGGFWRGGAALYHFYLPLVLK